MRILFKNSKIPIFLTNRSRFAFPRAKIAWKLQKSLRKIQFARQRIFLMFANQQTALIMISFQPFPTTIWLRINLRASCSRQHTILQWTATLTTLRQKCLKRLIIISPTIWKIFAPLTIWRCISLSPLPPLFKKRRSARIRLKISPLFLWTGLIKAQNFSRM